jgi:peptidoglycan-associated lipoprotein
MDRKFQHALGCAALGALLSGCFFGSLSANQDRAAAPAALAPVVTVTPMPVAATTSEAPATAPPPPAEPAPAPAVEPPAASLPNVVYFDNDGYVVRPEFEPMLQAHAQKLKADRKLRVAVRGHADGRGPAAYNRALAAKRAEMVVRALRARGVDATQLEIVALGRSRATGHDAAGSRRVELVYLR